MTVKELIEELSNYDDDQIVTVATKSIDGKLHLVTDVDFNYVPYINVEEDVVILHI